MSAVRRARVAAVTATALAAGLTLFVAARGPVRGLLGDVLVVVFLVGCLAVWPLWTARVRLAAVGALALGTEAFQATGWVPRDAPWWIHLTVGSTFDPLDFGAYAVGLVAAAACERWWRSH